MNLIALMQYWFNFIGNLLTYNKLISNLFYFLFCCFNKKC